MIYFNNPDTDNKQFVEIEIAKQEDVDIVVNMINREMPDAVEKICVDRTEPEILIEIPNSGLSVSLNAIKKKLANLLVTATVNIFTVDLTTEKQRCYR